MYFIVFFFFTAKQNFMLIDQVLYLIKKNWIGKTKKLNFYFQKKMDLQMQNTISTYVTRNKNISSFPSLWG